MDSTPQLRHEKRILPDWICSAGILSSSGIAKALPV
jgi:hypothetical protein